MIKTTLIIVILCLAQCIHLEPNSPNVHLLQGEIHISYANPQEIRKALDQFDISSDNKFCIATQEISP